MGVVSSAITGDFVGRYGKLNQPMFALPSWIFPVVWTILYIMMGLASYLLWSANPQTDQQCIDRKNILAIYFVQLAFNFFWSILFFAGQYYWLSFYWLLVMWIMIIALVIKSFGLRPMAAVLFVPYLLWTTFAAYLTLMIAILN